MPVFVYRAADRRGQTVDGVMEAPDARAVIERLHREAYYPIHVTPHAERQGWLRLPVAARIRQRDLLAFTQQLATLFEAGLPLDRKRAVVATLITVRLHPGGSGRRTFDPSKVEITGREDAQDLAFDPGHG